MIDWLRQIDTELFVFLNSAHTAWLDTVMYYVSTRWLWIPLYLLLAVNMWKRHHSTAPLYILMVILLILVSDQLSVGAKNYFQRLRPCHNTELAPIVHLVKGYCGGMYGFVSSHASNAFALATYVALITYRDRSWVLPVMAGYAVLVSYSRVYLGVHYPADILGGALLGAVAGVAVFVIANRLACRYCLTNPFNFGK